MQPKTKAIMIFVGLPILFLLIGGLVLYLSESFSDQKYCSCGVPINKDGSIRTDTPQKTSKLEGMEKEADTQFNEYIKSKDERALIKEKTTI